MKIFSIVGIVIGLLFAIIGLATTVPDDIIQTGVLSRDNRDRGGYHRYVGGDAYNFIIEASIRGGEIAGGRSARATYLTGGFIMATGSLIALGVSLDKEKEREQMKQLSPNLSSNSEQAPPEMEGQAPEIVAGNTAETEGKDV